MWLSRKKTILFAILTNTHTNTHTLHIYILLGNRLIRIHFNHLAKLNFTGNYRIGRVKHFFSLFTISYIFRGEPLKCCEVVEKSENGKS